MDKKEQLEQLLLLKKDALKLKSDILANRPFITTLPAYSWIGELGFVVTFGLNSVNESLKHNEGYPMHFAIPVIDSYINILDNAMTDL